MVGSEVAEEGVANVSFTPGRRQGLRSWEDVPGYMPAPAGRRVALASTLVAGLERACDGALALAQHAALPEIRIRHLSGELMAVGRVGCGFMPSVSPGIVHAAGPGYGDNVR